MTRKDSLQRSLPLCLVPLFAVVGVGILTYSFVGLSEGMHLCFLVKRTVNHSMLAVINNLKYNYFSCPQLWCVPKEAV